jgi:hypothetical protein
MAAPLPETILRRRSQPVSPDFIGDLLNALKRVVPVDVALMKDILIVSGMPESSENLRYLGFNRQNFHEENRAIEFSAVAVINNGRIAQWRLTGYREKVSRIVFSSHWTRNPMDLFINSLRCSAEVMEALAACQARYTLLGILRVEETQGTGPGKRKVRSIRPVLAAPGLEGARLERVAAFEKANAISKSSVLGFPFYRRVKV